MSEFGRLGSRAYALLIALTVAGYALVSGLPLVAGLPNRLVSVPYRGLLVLFSLALLVGVSVQRQRVHRGLVWIPFLVFWCLYALRLLLDIVLVPAPLRMNGLEYVAFATMCLLPALALLVRYDEVTLERAYRATLAVAATACIVALYLNAAAILAGDLTSLANMRLSSETLNAIALGNLGVSVSILSIFGLVHGSRGLRTAGLTLLLVAGLAAAGLSASRGPALAFALALPALIILGWRFGSRRRSLVLGIAVVTLAVAGSVYIEQRLGFGIVSRMQAFLSFSGDDSSQERLTLYQRAWSQFLDSPLLGNSLDETTSTYHPHNPVVEAFMATGFLGGTAFCVWILAALAAALRLFAAAPRHAWLSLLFGQYLLNALISGSLYWSADMWGLGAAVLGTAALVKDPQVVRSTADAAAFGSAPVSSIHEVT